MPVCDSFQKNYYSAFKWLYFKGIVTDEHLKNKDGIEMQFAVNHLGM